MPESSAPSGALERTALYDRHVALGARIVPFAGYEMPVQFPAEIIAEHTHTRQAAGLFDVSHMGQALLVARDHETAARFLEHLVPGDVLGLSEGQIRYTQLTNEHGGIIDDLMVTRDPSAQGEGRLMLVVNASRKQVDYAWLEQNLPAGAQLTRLEDRSLLALQGPRAEAALSRCCPEAAGLSFMSAAQARFDGVAIKLARSGYTGEDGFELSIPTEHLLVVYERLLAQPDVKPIGLGARDSLRLEAGLCLYGHDIDDATSPVEAGLAWSIGKRRRVEGGFTGAERILAELKKGPSRRRVGILPEGRSPAREGSAIWAEGRSIGRVTSGGFAPTLGRPIAMGYVESKFAAIGTRVQLIVRDKPLLAEIASLPFVPHRYKK
ncbi:MAG TPA: glycine cleavage system aminomethyltransferase GcvT [Aestuariivirgaceae bacterium]